MAEDFGKKLLVEVEEVALDEVLETLRLQQGLQHDYFHLPHLDRLLRTTIETRQHFSNKTRSSQPILEFTSTAPGAGKTQLLYHLAAIAVLPLSHGGNESCVVILDTDNSFSVPRLAQQIQLLLTNQPGTEADTSEPTTDTLALEALHHVHIFRPQSLTSTIATLTSIPAYLFDKTRHYSFERKVAFLAIDSASAFHWQAKAAEETSILLSSDGDAGEQEPLHGYPQLALALKSTIKTLHCLAILTSWYLGPIPTGDPHTAPSLRSSLPSPLSQLPTLRFLVRRVPVRKFPAGISIEEALREAADRLRAVEERRFECVVNEWDLEERVIGRLQRDGTVVRFRILAGGLVVEQDEERDGGDEVGM
ncbi:hypothetical protein LTR62_001516 [Meristemomyces frigidus]|uniref:DNA recombination and repair protein Rad51-like C-terminal domain-containing protein n=1 Tax=Meristemomyces frigidus TaxID=1508187 RepID=A0AAN7TGJ1_9PEZI|nr:hypothetical protein LTR62_001516 [Meristemomyces frigidus]